MHKFVCLLLWALPFVSQAEVNLRCTAHHCVTYPDQDVFGTFGECPGPRISGELSAGTIELLNSKKIDLKLETGLGIYSMNAEIAGSQIQLAAEDRRGMQVIKVFTIDSERERQRFGVSTPSISESYYHDLGSLERRVDSLFFDCTLQRTQPSE